MPSVPIKIVTYNIHGWRTANGKPNLDGVTDVLRAIDADIIGLNEVYYPRVVQGDARPALEALAARLGMHFVFGPCLRWPAEKDMPADAYGNALLSRWPIIASSAHHLTAKEEDKEGVLAGREQRGLLEGRILLPEGRTFTVYVTHLDRRQPLGLAGGAAGCTEGTADESERWGGWRRRQGATGGQGDGKGGLCRSLPALWQTRRRDLPGAGLADAHRLFLCQPIAGADGRKLHDLDRERRRLRPSPRAGRADVGVGR